MGIRSTAEAFPLFRLGFNFFGGMTTAGGYFVRGVEELDALSAAATARMDLASMRRIWPNWPMTMSSLVSSTRLMPVTLPTMGVVFKTKFPKWESLKINPERVACFSSPNPDHQLTIFHHQSTTNSPPKHHVLPPVFAKTHAKTVVAPSLKKYRQSVPSSGRFRPLAG